jgi:hypothetical protein
MKGFPNFLSDLAIGDILLVQHHWGHVFKDRTHTFIAVNEAVFSHQFHSSSNVVHAGIYDGNGNILESSGEAGLRSAVIDQKMEGTKYQVYRYSNVHVARAAAGLAEHLINRRPNYLKSKTGKGSGFGRYSKPGATHSLFSFSNRGKGAKKAVDELVKDPYGHRGNSNKVRGYYCSNFVVECFELACALLAVPPAINVDFRKISPKKLQCFLRGANSGWTYEGNYTV